MTPAPSVDVRVQRRGDSVEIVLPGAEPVGTDTAPADAALVDALARQVRAAVNSPDARGAQLHLAADHPADRLDPLPEAVADAAGFPHRRDLLQMRRPLPVAADPLPGVRPFTPRDADPWLRVNNRAFAAHADQGRETHETLSSRQAEPWFDPDDFLVLDDADRPGELAGFCWTKVHPPTATEPPLGEIYVIGIDPTRTGQGLGSRLVNAGLSHLGARGLRTAVLYVDADNTPAVALYDRLGFTTHARRRVYTS